MQIFNLKLDPSLSEMIEKDFRKKFEEIRNNIKSKNVFKLEFVGCEFVENMSIVNFIFNVNDVQTKIGISDSELFFIGFNNLFNKVLANLLLVNGGE